MANQNIDTLLYELNENSVESKFEKCKFSDPYPSIQPALLNHIDIKKYILSTGMIFPCYPDNLTNATYKIPLAGDVYWWEESGNGTKLRKSEHIPDGDTIKEVVLKKNSITYFHISTTFRVPYYMVFRFNLTVSLAHKGLLLGTGPIVDPGFEGRIMIPVHNLTANDYVLKAGSSLIRIEFTKLSHHPVFTSSAEFEDKYRFPENGKKWLAERYFENINNSNPIVSSIPDAMANAEASAVRANEEASAAAASIDKIKNVAYGAAIFSVIAIAVGMVYPTWNMINDTSIASKEFVKNDEELKKSLEKQEKKIIILENYIEELAKRLHDKN